MKTLADGHREELSSEREKRNPSMIRRLVLGLFVCLGQSTFAQDWPEWRGPHLDGTVSLDSPWPEHLQLEQVWSVSLGAGYSSVSVADGLAVTMFSDGVDDHLIAFDLEDGTEVWRHSLGPTYPGQQGAEDGPSTTPCLLDGVVVAAGPRGNLVAVDLEGGALLWSVDLVKDRNIQIPTYGFGGTPVALDNAVFVPGSNRNGHSGAAFDLETGDVLWTLQAGFVGYQGAIRFGAGRLLVADSSNLFLLDATDGQVLFQAAHGDPRDLIFPQFVPIGNQCLLMVGEDETRLVEVDLEKGLTTHWRSREFNDAYAAPVVHDGSIYGLSGMFLVCADLETGRRRWKSREPGSRGVIAVGDRLALLSSAGEVVLVRATSEGYQEDARLVIGERGGYSPPTYADGRLLVRNTERLVATRIVSAKDSTEAGREEVLPGVLGSLLSNAANVENPQALVDQWWQGRESFPVIEEGWVHFVYRGRADNVALIGDMVPDRNLPESMHRLPGTDLFHRSYRYPEGGVWQYAFLIDYTKVIPDPLNPTQCLPVMGLNGNPRFLGYFEGDAESVVKLPGWMDPSFLQPKECDSRLETIPYQAPSFRTSKDFVIYVPAGYDSSTENYPVLYVSGGDAWLEHGKLKNALDQLMGTRIAPALVALVPYHVGSADRIGGEGVAQMMRDELRSGLRRRYRTDGRGAVLGSADDATAAVIFGFESPELVPRIAVLSPYLDPEDFVHLETLKEKPDAVFLEWSQYEARIQDENTDYRASAQRFEQFAKQRGSRVVGGEVVAGPGWVSWSARLEEVLSFLLPLQR